MTPEEKLQRKRENDRRYRERHKEKIQARDRERSRVYAQTHKEERAETQRKYREKNRDKINERNRERYKENPQVFKDRTAKYFEKNRLAKIRNRFVVLIDTYVVRRGYTGDKTIWDMLGCDFETFMAYIESQFLEGMTIDNHGKGEGKWNFDHIEPACNAKSNEDFERLNHYTNFRPMWSRDNLRKSTKAPK